MEGFTFDFFFGGGGGLNKRNDYFNCLNSDIVVAYCNVVTVSYIVKGTYIVVVYIMEI